MIAELDIYRTAKIYIDQYGEEALFQAMCRAENYREVGDNNGAALWGKIADAIDWLQLPADSFAQTCH